MKRNVVVAVQVAVRMTELGAFELVVKDPVGQTHTVVFLAATGRRLRNIWLEEEPAPGDLLEVQSISASASKRLKRVAAIERSQSAGWSVHAIPEDQLVSLAVRDPDGSATLTLLDPAETLRLAETLHQALALLNPASGTAH